MQTYYVTKHYPISGGAKPEAVRAENIDNLRRNLGKKLKVHDLVFVYSQPFALASLGSLGRYGKRDDVPELLWIDNIGRSYAVSKSNGTIRRI